MPHIIRKVTVGLLSLLCLVLLAARVAHGETPHVLAEEVREFEILVNDKATGTSQIKITEMDDGVTIVSTDVDVKFDFIIYVYGYELHGKETWQGNHLASVDNRAIDNGTKLVVRAKVDPQGSTIEAPGKPAAKGPVLDMTSSFWRSPAIKGGLLSFLDVDKGTVLSASVEQLGADPIVVAGDKLSCTHYRFRGGLVADIWFDTKGRLVRQRTVEMGFPTEIRLVRITASGAPLANR